MLERMEVGTYYSRTLFTTTLHTYDMICYAADSMPGTWCCFQYHWFYTHTSTYTLTGPAVNNNNNVQKSTTKPRSWLNPSLYRFMYCWVQFCAKRCSLSVVVCLFHSFREMSAEREHFGSPLAYVYCITFHIDARVCGFWTHIHMCGTPMYG